VSNPLAKPATKSAERAVVFIRFADHGRIGAANTSIREVRAGRPHPAAAPVTLEEEERGLGIWVDGRILVPWSNLLWVEYEA
jgi:hypothetical protein